MEGVYWIRLSVVAALFLGSAYVLAPTVIEAIEGDDAMLGEAATSVKTSQGPGAGSPFVVELSVASGDPEALAAALDLRLRTAGVPLERVSVVDGEVVTRLRPGGDRASVITLGTKPGMIALHAVPVSAPTGAVAAPEGLALGIPELFASANLDLAPWSGRLATLPGQAAPAEFPAVSGLSALLVQTDAGAVLQASAAVPAESWFLVTVDGAVAGVGARTPAVEADPKALSFVRLPTDPVDPIVDMLLVAGPLPGKLTEPVVEAVAQSPSEAPAEAAPVVSVVPDWFRNILPNTAISRGLDLQGGVDLTLQVELDEAVSSQVARHASEVKTLAAKENLVIESVRREKGAPTLWITTAVTLGDLQSFMNTKFAEYAYSESNGTSHAFTLTDARVTAIQTSAVEQVLATLRKRIDATGVKEPTIVKKGGGRINVQLPGKVDMQAAVDAIGTTALLEFRLVDEEFDTSVLERIVKAAEDALPADQYAEDDVLNEWLWESGRLPDDRMVLWEYEETTDSPARVRPYALKSEVILTGNDVGDASVSFDQYGRPAVALAFKPRGAQIFCDVTTANVKKRFAIILDNQIKSAPNIRERICGGRASIEMSSGDDPLKDANTLALVLRTGSLDAPVSVGEVRQVGATLGRDAIRSGSIASLVGGSFVICFMMLWYRRAGFIADIALVLNVMLVLSAMGIFGATLTLPGIAGIALTMGMAVDANIIVYERIKEELRLGVHMRKAVDTGYEKALVAILDSNITTAIAGVVLFSYGTGPIKGFAVTLLIGIATTMVTALFVTRTLMDVVTRSSATRLNF